MEQPRVYSLDDYHDLEGTLQPVYPLFQGMKNKQMAALIGQALEELPAFEDYLSREERDKLQLCGRDEAMRGIHHPADMESLAKARNRLIFDEFFDLGEKRPVCLQVRQGMCRIDVDDANGPLRIGKVLLQVLEVFGFDMLDDASGVPVLDISFFGLHQVDQQRIVFLDFIFPDAVEHRNDLVEIAFACVKESIFPVEVHIRSVFDVVDQRIFFESLRQLFGQVEIL
jgi:hypothetical protein